MRKFLRLLVLHRSLVIKTMLLLGVIQLGLWLLPFQTLQRLLKRLTQVPPTPHETDPASIDRVVWAVAMASRYVPKATCLTQALAAQMLLVRRGYPIRLRIGVVRTEAGQFQAHAWVEHQGRVVIGGAEAPVRFTPLPLLEETRE